MMRKTRFTRVIDNLPASTMPMNATVLQQSWNRLVSIGLQDQLPESEKKFIRFTNIVALLTAVAVGSYIPYSLYTGATLLAGLQTVDTFCVLLVLWLNAQRQYCFAKLMYMAVINLFIVINACFIGFHSHVHDFLFISNIVPFLLYRVNDYKGILSGMALSLGAFVAYHYCYPYFTAYNLPLADQESIFRINTIMKFVLFSAALYILAAYTYRTELALEKSNQKLTEQATELQRSNQDLEQFAYIISHDLKTPVANIHSLLTNYLNRYSPPGAEGRAFTEHAQQSAARLSTLIDDLLSYCKVGRNLPPVQPTDVHQLLQTIRLEMNEKLAAKNASIEVQPNLPTLHQVHTTMVYHVFQNLISNGIKFNNRERPVVQIGCTEAGGRYIFSVKDNGIGIPRQHFEKLFDMFKRLHTTEYEGTGMGLAICKKIVQHYGGQIWIESTPGEGTTFFFDLEKSPAQRPGAMAYSVESTPSTLSPVPALGGGLL